MAKTKQALGRGLTALIPEVEEETGNNVIEIETSRIIPNPYQPREEFAEEEIQELAASIKENGLLQPIVVCKNDDTYEIIYGERRFRAFKKLGNTTIPAIVKDSISDIQKLSMALVENIQRQNLNEIEEAKAYEALLTKCGFTHEKLAQYVGKSRTAVTNALRLLKLPEPVQKKLLEKQITMGHARALLSIEQPAEIESICSKIIEEGYSVRQTEELVRKGIPVSSKPSSGGRKTKESQPLPDPNIEEMCEQLRYALGTQVRIFNRNNKGKIEIEYYNESDLDRIYTVLLKQTT